MPDPRNDAELADATAKGIRWVSFARVVTELTLIGSMVVLARLIPPSAFGMFAIAAIIQDLAINVPAEGIGTALVQRKEISREHLQTGLLIGILGGLLLAGITLILCVLVVEPIFDADTAKLVALTTPGIVIGGIAAIPVTILRRRLDFRRMSILDLTQNITRAGVSIFLAAALGLNGAALVIGGLASCLSLVILGGAFTGIPLPRWHRQAAREILPYGGPAALACFAWAGFRNGDYAVIGAKLGTATAGIYWRGFQLAVEYQRKISTVMTQIAFPVLARTVDGDQMFALRRRMVRLLAVVVFPLLTLLAILAPSIVPWLFGPDWAPAVQPTQLLIGAGAATVIIDAVGSVLMAEGRARALLGYGVAHFAVYVGVVLIVASHGIVAVAIAASSVHIVFLVIAYQLLVRGRDESAVRMLWHDVSAAFVSCLVLAAAGIPVQVGLTGAGAPAIVHLLLVGLAGGLAYLISLRLFFRVAWGDVMALARRVLPTSRLPRIAQRALAAGPA